MGRTRPKRTNKGVFFEKSAGESKEGKRSQESNSYKLAAGAIAVLHSSPLTAAPAPPPTVAAVYVRPDLTWAPVEQYGATLLTPTVYAQIWRQLARMENVARLAPNTYDWGKLDTGWARFMGLGEWLREKHRDRWSEEIKAALMEAGGLPELADRFYGVRKSGRAAGER